MGATRNVYKVLRSIIFTVILTVVGLYTLLYIALSVPTVQQYIGKVAERELSKLLGTHVSIGHVSLSLGGEVHLEEVEVPCPDGTDFASIDKLGAGIDLGELIFKRRIVFTEVYDGAVIWKISADRIGPLRNEDISHSPGPEKTEKTPATKKKTAGNRTTSTKKKTAAKKPAEKK